MADSKMIIAGVVLVGIALALIGITLLDTNDYAEQVQDDLDSAETVDDVAGEEIIVTDFVALKDREVQTTSGGLKYIVDPREIRGGGPPKDGIPSIDNPKYVSVQDADEWIQDNELGLAIIHNGVKRFYPLQIMVWHEIVNDEIDGDPILITYCPLCGSGIAYIPEVDGEIVEFGTSGKLWNSNLVMYDRKTDSYWSQIDGISIVGERTGDQLEAISIDTVVWRDWKAAHEDSEVLSQDTGYTRAYGRDPYGNYYEDSFLIFPVDNQDNRIHAKTVIFGINVDGAFKAYQEDDIIAAGSFEDEVNGRTIVVNRDSAGIVTFIDKQSGVEYVKERDFWFAWYAFHPDTGLYEQA